MIKKITLALLLCCIIISCGKKGDPKYKDPKEKVKLQTFLINKV
jgi:predicted small lipoprotein YifL